MISHESLIYVREDKKLPICISTELSRSSFNPARWFKSKDCIFLVLNGLIQQSTFSLHIQTRSNYVLSVP